MLIHFVLNTQPVSAELASTDLLSDVVREKFGLTGTHVGCDTSQCGACVVHLNGRSVKSCSVLAITLEGAEVTTIEGLSGPAGLHPMQQAFHEAHGLQCGFCTPGMVMSAVDFARR
ncbi:(2Fe-2S)-binding protein, partial [Aquabacterium sp.]|uniref:(2Fe-2S)-binding protein n=1 Tax=Aquabacterium sp. TaxID=1872578 RepID=UPI002CDD10C3